MYKEHELGLTSVVENQAGILVPPVMAEILRLALPRGFEGAQSHHPLKKPPGRTLPIISHAELYIG
jgi:hypothetical protein